MSKRGGDYHSDGHFGEIVENPHSGLRFMVIGKHKANPAAWEERLAIVVRRRNGAFSVEDSFKLGDIHHISPDGWKQVDE